MDWTSISSQPSQLSHEVQESPDYPLSKADIRPPDRMTARKSSRKVTPDLAQASDALVNEEEDHDANDVQIVTADEIAEREAQRQTACLATNAASRLQETLQINPEEVAWGYPSPKRQQNVEFDDFKLSWWPELERETTKQKERRERNVSQGLRATRRAEQRRLDGTCWRKSWSCRGRADVEREMIVSRFHAKAPGATLTELITGRRVILSVPCISGLRLARLSLRRRTGQQGQSTVSLPMLLASLTGTACPGASLALAG